MAFVVIVKKAYGRGLEPTIRILLSNRFPRQTLSAFFAVKLSSRAQCEANCQNRSKQLEFREFIFTF